MGGTGSSSLRSWRTYRVIARARCVNTADGVSSGVVTTLLWWRRRATTPLAIDASRGRGRTGGALLVVRTLAVRTGIPARLEATAGVFRCQGPGPTPFDQFA